MCGTCDFDCDCACCVNHDLCCPECEEPEVDGSEADDLFGEESV